MCDSILGTLLNIYGKRKVGLSARLDLQERRLGLELHSLVGK